MSNITFTKRNLNNVKEEMEMLEDKEAKEKEYRLNTFYRKINSFREDLIIRRDVKSKDIKVKDFVFKSICLNLIT